MNYNQFKLDKESVSSITKQVFTIHKTLLHGLEI